MHLFSQAQDGVHFLPEAAQEHHCFLQGRKGWLQEKKGKEMKNGRQLKKPLVSWTSNGGGSPFPEERTDYDNKGGVCGNTNSAHVRKGKNALWEHGSSGKMAKALSNKHFSIASNGVGVVDEVFLCIGYLEQFSEQGLVFET